MASYHEAVKISIVKLNTGNYHQWRFSTEMLLLKENLWDIVSNEKPEEITPIWKRQDNSARGTIALSVEVGLHPLIMECQTSKEMWDKLKAHFERVSYSSRIFLKRKLYNTKLLGNNMEEYIGKITEITTRLKASGARIEDEDIISILLCGLSDSYDTMIMAMEGHDKSIVSIDLIKMKLMDESTRREEKLQGMGQPQALTTSETKSKNYQYRNERVCYECRKTGHIRFQCPNLRRRPEFERSNYNGNNQEVRKESNYLSFDSTEDEHSSREREATECHNLRLRNKEEKINYCSTSGEAVEQSEKFYAYVSLTNKGQPIKTISQEWVIDSGATAHMSHNKELFEDYQEFKCIREVVFANGTSSVAVGKGNVTINIELITGNQSLELTDVLYVPEMFVNLMSIPHLSTQHCRIVFENDQCNISRDDILMLTGNIREGIFIVTPISHIIETSYAACIHTWHKRLGHRSLDKIKQLSKSLEVKNLTIDGCDHPDFCKTCELGGMRQATFKSVQHRQSSRPFQLIHTDLCGPIRPTSRGGGSYFMTLVDDYSRYCYVEILAYKSDSIFAIKRYIEHFRNKFGYYPESLRSDGGGEFENFELNHFLSDRGINHQLSIPMQPQQNGIAERINQTLIRMTKCLLIEKTMSKNLWGEALSTSCYLYNRLIHSYTGSTPYYVWEGRPADLGNLKIVGSQCFAHVPKQGRLKLDNNSVEAILLGFDGRYKGYKLLETKNNKIIVSRSTCFNENEQIDTNKYSASNEEEAELIIKEDYHEVANEPVERDVPRRSTRNNLGKIPARFRE